MRTDGGLPRYQLLARRLREEIEAGRYPPGSLLPTELEISAQFNVSRATVREAIRQLQVDGLVSRRAGVGTRVEASKPIGQYVQSGSSIEELISDGAKIRVIPREMDDIVAHGELAKHLKCKAGQGFLRVRGTVVAAEVECNAPYYWLEIYIAAAFAGVRDRLSNHVGLVAELVREHYGEQVREIQQEISAVLVDPSIARQLRVAPKSPALQFQRWYYGSQSSPFLISSSIRPAERFTYRTKIVRRGAA